MAFKLAKYSRRNSPLVLSIFKRHKFNLLWVQEGKVSHLIQFPTFLKIFLEPKAYVVWKLARVWWECLKKRKHLRMKDISKMFLIVPVYHVTICLVWSVGGGYLSGGGRNCMGIIFWNLPKLEVSHRGNWARANIQKWIVIEQYLQYMISSKIDSSK